MCSVFSDTPLAYLSFLSPWDFGPLLLAMSVLLCAGFNAAQGKKNINPLQPLQHYSFDYHIKE